MAGLALKVQRFFGEAPKVSGELLPNTVAQYAYNLDLSSGDLLPYRRSQVVANLTKDGVIRTIYPLTDPTTGDLKWLHWTTDVDVATAQVEGDTSQRIYYTGEDIPRVTDYALATSGAVYPSASYKMGLPLPISVPIVSAAAFTQKSSTLRSRDAGNNATITTSAPHGLTTGDYVTTTSFGDGTYNLSNVRVTVVSDTKFSFFSFGDAEAEVADTAGRIDLAGVTQPRDYVYTFLTAWDEESVPSEPSDSIFIKEGQAVTVKGIPSIWLLGDGYQEAGMKVRIYRTVAGVSGAAYFRVAELDMGTPTAATYTRVSDLVTITSVAHGLATDDYVAVRKASGATTAAVHRVTVVDADTFTFTDLATAADETGTIEFAAALSFTDDEDVATLDNILESADYDPPDERMQGLLAIHNSMMVGFFNNTLCFSEPGVPHAWPIKYRRQVDSNIVALGAYGTTLLALTDRTPWKIDGNNPQAVSLTRTDYVLPCVSKRSVLNLGFGVVWASAGGLAVYSTTIGTDYLTKNVHSWSTWPQKYDAENLYGAYYRGRYFGSDGVNTFLFERNEEVGGNLVQSDVRFTAAHYDANTDKFYYAAGDKVWLWNSQQVGNAILDWKSKVFVTKAPLNMGAAQIIGDFDSEEDAAALVIENNNITIANQAIIDSGDPMGAMGTAMANELRVAGSRLNDYRQSTQGATFQFFVNKKLVYSSSRQSSEPFRLPAGYRADTFEFRVSTNVRIRAVHMAETMAGLRGS